MINLKVFCEPAEMLIPAAILAMKFAVLSIVDKDIRSPIVIPVYFLHIARLLFVKAERCQNYPKMPRLTCKHCKLCAFLMASQPIRSSYLGVPQDCVMLSHLRGFAFGHSPRPDSLLHRGCLENATEEKAKAKPR